MKSTKTGFTIVELLIVIVVIAILAAITTVAYNGIQTRAKNAGRLSEVTTVIKVLESYKAFNGDYPGVSSVVTGGVDKKFCIGTNFPNNKCDDGTVDATDVTYTNKLATISSVSTSHFSVPGGRTGPVVNIWGTGYGLSLMMWMQGSQASDCPSQIPNLWWKDPGSDAILCAKNYDFKSQMGA